MRQRNEQIRSVRDLGPVALEHYEVARSFGDRIFTTGEFESRYENRYPERPRGSMLLADYRFNEPSPSAYSECSHHSLLACFSRKRFAHAWSCGMMGSSPTGAGLCAASAGVSTPADSACGTEM